ncbi:hypothetical protein [Herbaspirillum huttiense]|uniref:hypothetical protein n=1 Tax=Herbaspirillum huttiense TaxID=863372 RepID=UPI0039AEF1CC
MVVYSKVVLIKREQRLLFNVFEVVLHLVDVLAQIVSSQEAVALGRQNLAKVLQRDSVAIQTINPQKSE